MTNRELFDLVGKNVYVYFKNEERGIYGMLNYAESFSAEHRWRKPGYFYIGECCFKVTHVRKVVVDNETIL